MSYYNPLHLKYRPRSLEELIGQEAIARTLTNALSTGRIAPAYLLSGSRGTGKTSTARVLARSLNCTALDAPTPTPCGECALCVSITDGSALDVIEVDAASNNSVDNVRELIESARYRPVNARYKVFIIDECHALSGSATQALLKTLESPPPGVVFILCTTEPARLGATILSRCQRYNFRDVDTDTLTGHLKAIAALEGIDITNDALRPIARHAGGAVRDALTLLDGVRLLGDDITVSDVYGLIGEVDEETLLSLVEAIAASDAPGLIATVRGIRSGSPVTILNNLIAFYTDLILALKDAPETASKVSAPVWERLKAIDLTSGEALRQQTRLRESGASVKFSRVPELMLESVLLGLLAEPEPVGTTGVTVVPGIDTEELWRRAIERVQPSIRALLKGHARLLGVEGGTVTVGVSSEPLRQHLSRHSASLAASFGGLLGREVTVALT
jgi:DNA polymerase III subunit gamma/tau